MTDSAKHSTDQNSGDPIAEVAQAAETKSLTDQEITEQAQADRPVEIGGPKGPEPTRYGDWEHKGRCIDF